MDRITTLRAERAAVVAKGMALLAKAETDKARLTDEQMAESDGYKAEIKAIDYEMSTLADFTSAHEASERQREAATAQATQATQAAKPKADSLPTPFKSFGDQLKAVQMAAINPHATDPRLLEIQAAGTGANEAAPSDGGFRVQTDFSGELIKLVHAAAVLAGKTDRTPIGPNSNGLKINAIDETSRVDGSRWGSVLAYWTSEGATLTASRPKYRQIELSLQKLTGLYYATDELLMDTTALGAEATTAFTEEFGFKLDDALLRGTGAGMPLGVLGHAGTVSITKETNQTAATINTENVQKMYARMIASSMSRAEWYINQDCWPALFQMSQVVGLGGVPVFLNANMANAPFGTLMGRPITPIEQASTVGTVGDIIFADFSQYKMIEKGGINADSSIHVAFLTDETVFRWTLRTDGQPKRNAALTPYKGTNSLSPFITLATRA